MDVQIFEWETAGSTPEITIERLKLNVIFRQIQVAESSQIFPGTENHSTTRIITQEFEVFLVKVILQGIPYWNIKSNLGLTDRNMQVRFGFRVVQKILRFGNLWNNNQFLWKAYCAPSIGPVVSYPKFSGDFLSLGLNFVQVFFWFRAYMANWYNIGRTVSIS